MDLIETYVTLDTSLVEILKNQRATKLLYTMTIELAFQRSYLQNSCSASMSAIDATTFGKESECE